MQCLDSYTLSELHEHMTTLRTEVSRLKGLGGNVNDIEWIRLGALDNAIQETWAAIDLLNRVTYGDALYGINRNIQ